ncbi:hypothetical protein AMD27_16760 (plasmid) [Acinetobacter sp. TGL-Y2]|uniref:Eco57I restriction-modification methylase domain-containing protein n=1 Tax=Acinetobacter sp. TGL-Y2 TaxID=1407071 RepID=UPI0007A66468|nr:N-6 DNA methylase [Acinetobacter sp. TGL-Y2]AMW80568.1 hypothetical protein AMD27_16760 [Acinetobacter sp. TGL-Y2]
MNLNIDFNRENENRFSQVSKFESNILAIKLLKEIEVSNELPSIEQIEILKSYVGWGGISSAFPNSKKEFINPAWQERNKELKSILTEEEYKTANESILDAFFTPKTIINAMWKAVDRLGVKGGIAIEPSCGTGRFIYENDNADNFKFVAIEKDSITARLAKYLTKDKAYVFATGFEKLSIPYGFDLAIGNPPYGDISIDFKESGYAENCSIHNQFILHTLNKLKNDGVAIFVVSRYVMDAENSYTRYEASKLASLVSAIRLPSSAFKSEAGTDVITDILVFKRHSSSTEYSINQSLGNLTYEAPYWVKDLSNIADENGNSVKFNSYFLDHKNIAGRLKVKSSQFGFTLDVAETAPLIEHLNRWTLTIPEFAEVEYNPQETNANFEAIVAHLYIEMSGKQIGVVDRNEKGELYRIIEQDYNDRILYKSQILSTLTVWSPRYAFDSIHGYYENLPMLDKLGNKVYCLDESGLPTSRLEYTKNFVDESEISSRSKLGLVRLKKLDLLIDIRDLLLLQIEAESNDYPDSKIEENRVNLKKAYDKFVKRNGYINNPSTVSLINELPDAGLLLSLEYEYRKPVKEFVRTTDDGKKVYKTISPEHAEQSAILNQRVIYKSKMPDSAESCEHGLLLSLTHRGFVDLEFIASLCDCSVESVVEALYSETAKPQIFYDHDVGAWVHHSQFLSGNVVKKYRLASLSSDDIAVKALDEVMPERISIENIGISFGMKWIPDTIYQSFVQYLTDDEKASVKYHLIANTYDIVLNPSIGKESIYGTEQYSLFKILDKLINSITIRVNKTVLDHLGHEKRVLDETATEAAIEQSEIIKAEFLEWIYAQQESLEDLENIYNEKFNAFVVPKFDGTHLVIPDKVPDAVFKLRQHQLDGIYRGIVSPFMCAAHSVGAGKTALMICIAMMRKKLGLSQKPAMVVPNHLIHQMASDIYRLFPSANVLAATAKDFEKKSRRRLISRIATGDYDLILIPHTSFEFMKLSDGVRNSFLEEEIKIVQDALAESEDRNGNSRSAKSMMNSLQRLEKNLIKRINEKRNDNLIAFEDLGITYIAVDESDIFKNLPYVTQMRDIVGLGNPAGSNRALDLFLKVKWLHRSGGGASYYTGTPISNSGSEMYSILRSLCPDVLDDLNILSFDNWASTYAENITKFEATESGKLKQVTRFAREWRNLRSLMGIWAQVVDTITNDDIKRVYLEQTGKEYPLPRIKGGVRQPFVTEPTKEQETVLDSILARYAELESIQDLKDRNAERLRLMDLAKKVSLSARCVDPIIYANEKGGKLELMADEIFKTHQEWDYLKGTQLVFLDRSVPKTKSDLAVIKVYDSLTARLDQAIIEENEGLIQSLENRLEHFNTDEIENLRLAQSTNWSAYQEIKDLLVLRGVAPDQVRFIQEANTDIKKKELFDLVNAGEVRVLIGSTQRMGAGSNIQKRLVRLHHGDVTWRPRDLEQREGRIIRQGNMIYELLGHENFEVEISCYLTERSCDAKYWEVNSAKLKMILAIRNYQGEHSIDFGEDVDAVSMAEIAALATGNPLMLERCELDVEIQQLMRLNGTHSRKQSSITMQYKRAEAKVISLPEKMQSYQNSFEKVFKNSYMVALEKANNLEIMVNGIKFKDEKFTIEYLEKMKSEKKPIKLAGAVLSFTKAKDLVKNYFKKSVPYSFTDNEGNHSDSCLDMGVDVYKKALKVSNDCIQIGSLFGLPVFTEKGLYDSVYTLFVTGLDEATVLASRQTRSISFNQTELSGLLLRLSQDLELELRTGPKYLQLELDRAISTAKQLKPLLNLEFNKAAELKYKRLRLKLVQEALTSDDSETHFHSLIEENKAVIDDLMLCMSKAQTKNSVDAVLGCNEVKSEIQEIAIQCTTAPEVSEPERITIDAITLEKSIEDYVKQSKTEVIKIKKNKQIVCNVVVDGKMVKAVQMDLF